MPQLIVIDRAGSERVIDAAANFTVMEILRGAGFDEMLALCGGVCSCATCHVHVDSAFAAKLPARTQDESDLLDASAHKDELSRLSCQISLRDDLSGMRITIADED